MEEFYKQGAQATCEHSVTKANITSGLFPVFCVCLKGLNGSKNRFKSVALETRTGICVVNTHGGSFRASISHSRLKSQSAMEYLMTYGWAILIIAVVLGALFSLGVFNGNNFAPKASPGACQVFRPNGPGTTMDINLAGECQGLEPQYAGGFSGQSSISVPASEMPYGNAPRTIVAWINPNSDLGNRGIFYYGDDWCPPDGAIFGLILNSGYLYLWGGWSLGQKSATLIYAPLHKHFYLCTLLDNQFLHRYQT